MEIVAVAIANSETEQFTPSQVQIPFGNGDHFRVEFTNVPTAQEYDEFLAVLGTLRRSITTRADPAAMAGPRCPHAELPATDPSNPAPGRKKR